MKFIAELRSQPLKRRLILMMAALLVQAVIVAALLPQIGLAAGTVSLVTIILGGFLFGITGGVLSVVIAILVNALLGAVIINEPFSAFLRGGILIGVVALMIVGAVIGYLSNLQYKLFSIRSTLEHEVAERTEKLQVANRELRAEVAERQETEIALQQAKTTLEGATQARDHFLASISHELRTPLTMIMGQSDALLEGLYEELNHEQAEAVEQILQSSNHLLKLIDNILDYNRFTTKNMLINPERVTIAPIYLAASQMVERMANEKNIELIHEDYTDGLFVEVDEVQVTQMLVNLLDNAIKFTPKNGQVGIIVTTEPNTAAQEGTISLVVWDTGIGMTQDAIDSVFEPFVQIPIDDSIRRTGAGLGLSLVRQMVELHQGHIGVESTIGQGSRFTITLPIRTV